MSLRREPAVACEPPFFDRSLRDGVVLPRAAGAFAFLDAPVPPRAFFFLAAFVAMPTSSTTICNRHA